METDRIELEILGNMFGAVAEQMGSTIGRTAYTTFVRETHDFGAGLIAPEGKMFAWPRTLGASTLMGLPFAEALAYIDSYDPGDLIYTTDPFSSGAACTHVPDVTVWAPVFVAGELLCFSYGFIHSSDMGGAVAGSIAPGQSEPFQEGLRIPPTKLYAKGEENTDIRRVIQTNVRIPREVWGDIQALRSSMNQAERKLRDLADRYGVNKLRAAIPDLLEYAEAKARRVIADIPDGTYEFSDYLEDDTVSDIPICIELAMTVDGEHIEFDYTGTDPQVASAYNVPTGGKVHPWIMSGLSYFIVSQDPDIPTNAGMLNTVSAKLPEGSLVNPVFPAAIGLRSVSGCRLVDVFLGALGRGAPEKAPAAGSGVSTIVLLSVPDYRRARRRIHVVNPCTGGTGGRPGRDGFDGNDFTLGFLRNTPAEILEAETDIAIRRYNFRRDSAGAGEYRGGLGIELEFEVRSPDATLIARGMERTRFRPWGAEGGQPGALMAPAVVNPGTSKEEHIRKIDVLRPAAGDVILFQTSGGGGYGNPLVREPDRVWSDVESGFVSRAAAKRDYGVIFMGDGQVDVRETDVLREHRRAALESRSGRLNGRYEFGKERDELDRVWTPEARDSLRGMTDRLPPLLRSAVKNRVYEALVVPGRTKGITAHEIVAAFAEVKLALNLSDQYDAAPNPKDVGPSEELVKST